jgi:ribosomal protein S18 acetylase RimI-like enzyme
MKRVGYRLGLSEVTIRKARDDELKIIKEMSVKQTILELDEYERQEKERIEKDDMKRLDVFFKKEGNEFYVAEVGKSREMAGYVWLGVSERPFSGNKVGWIYDIQVLPSYRGKGVGEALMRHALQVSREQGFGQAGLMVNSKNTVALSLYEKLGFQTEYRVMTRREGDPLSTSKSYIRN